MAKKPKDTKSKLQQLKQKSKKKNRSHKVEIVQKMRDHIPKFQHIILLKHDNLTAAPYKKLQLLLKETSRIFIAKNSLMQMALGKDKKEAQAPKLHKLAKKIQGDCSLLMTNEKLENIIEIIRKFSSSDYAKPGAIAQDDVILPAGLITFQKFGIFFETTLRKLGLPVEIQNGQIALLKNYTVCEKGKELNANQCKILRYLKIRMGTFQVKPVLSWSNDGTLNKYD